MKWKKPKSHIDNIDKTLFTLHQLGHQVNEPLFQILCLWSTNERTENNRWVRLNSTERKNSSQDSTQCLVSPVASAWTCKVLVCEMDPPSHRQRYCGTTFSEETARLTGLRCGSDWWTTHERDNRTLPITQQLKASSTNRLWNNAKHERGLCVWHGRKGQLGRHSWTLRPKTAKYPWPGRQTALPGQLVAGIVLLSSCASVKSSTYASFEHTIVNRLLEEKNDVSKRIPATILLCLQLYGHVWTNSWVPLHPPTIQHKCFITTPPSLIIRHSLKRLQINHMVSTR